MRRIKGLDWKFITPFSSDFLHGQRNLLIHRVGIETKRIKGKAVFVTFRKNVDGSGW